MTFKKSVLDILDNESIVIGVDMVEQITKPKLSQLFIIRLKIYCNVGIDMKINFKCMHVSINKSIY